MRVPLSAAITLALLSGCGEPEKDPDNEPRQPDLIDYSHLDFTRPTTGPLQLADEATLARHIKNGLRLTMASTYSSSGGSSSSASKSFIGVSNDPAADRRQLHFGNHHPAGPRDRLGGHPHRRTQAPSGTRLRLQH